MLVRVVRALNGQDARAQVKVEIARSAGNVHVADVRVAGDAGCVGWGCGYVCMYVCSGVYACVYVCVTCV